MVSKKDLKIIEMLQEDSRIPMTNIAKAVGMSENGVRYRLNKLESQGIIRRFTLLVDPVKVGKGTMAIFDIDVDPKKVRDSIDKMKHMDPFIKIYQTTGEYSIMAVGLFDSASTMNSFVNETFLRNISVQNYTVNIVTRKYKDSIFMV